MSTALHPAGREAPSGPRRRTVWSVLACVELLLATVTIVLDLLVPTLVILALAVVSLVARRRGFPTIGFHRVVRPSRLVGITFAAAIGWTVFQFGLVMPVLNHLTGDRQDLATFEDLQGDVGLLAVLLAASWTLGIAEETVFRGYLQTRVTDVLGVRGLGIVTAVLVTSVLFGLIHTEQGVIGVVLTSLDGLFFSWLRWHHRTLWAAVLGHGFNNTIGVVTFFLVGPVYGLW